VSDKSKPEQKNLKAIWREEERLKRKQAIIDVAKTSNGAYSGPDTAEEADALSDWEKLAKVARVIFPEHLAAKYSISPNYRLAAIAYKLGWPVEKISKASGKAARTIYDWLKRPEVIEFMDAFEYHRGSKDAKEMVDKEQYNSLLVLKELRDDPSVSPGTRKEIAIWMYEQKHGKPKEHKEITGMSVRALTEELMKARESQTKTIEAIDQASDEDLFSNAN